MRIAYATTYDATNVANWSGLGTFIARALEQQGLDLAYVNVGGLTFAERSYGKLRSRLSEGRYLADRGPHATQRRARRIRRLLPAETDLLLSPGTLPVAGHDPPPPFAMWADATFASMVGFYPGFAGLTRSSIKFGHENEKRALENCAAAIYASEWAAASAVRDYGADARKIHAYPSARIWTVCQVKPKPAAWSRRGRGIAATSCSPGSIGSERGANSHLRPRTS